MGVKSSQDSLNILLKSMPPVKQRQVKVKPLIDCDNVFSRKQQDFLDTPLRRLNILDGAVRSGKTYISLFKWVQFVRTAPIGQNFIMVGRTLTTLKRNCLDLVMQIAGADNFEYSLSKKEAVLFKRVVYLEGADNVQAEDKIRGMTLYGAYLDEITLLPESFFAMMLSRLSVKGAVLLGTTNPDSKKHWLHKNYLIKPELGIARWRFTMDDNPGLDEEYKAALKAEYAGSPLRYDRFILGKWVNAEGSVYREFTVEKCVRSRAWYNEFIRTYPIAMSAAGGDFGGNKSATALYNTVFTRNLDFVIVTEEYYNEMNESSDVVLEDIIARSKRWKRQYKCREMFLDSAETLMVRTVKRKADIYVHGSLKTRINNRIQLLSTLIHQGRFFILDECPALIDAIESAVYDPKKDDDERLDDGTTNIDSLDALEYSLEKYTKKLLRI